MSYVSPSPFMNNIETSDFRRVRTVAVNQSPFNGATYRSGMQDDRWQFRFDYQMMTRAQALPLLTAIAAQRNGTGFMNVFDPDFMLGQFSPNRTFNMQGTMIGGGQLGPSIFTQWPTVGLIARAGDKMWVYDGGVDTRMYEVLEDSYTDGAGRAFTLLDAPLRTVVASGSTVGVDWSQNDVFFRARMVDFQKQSRPGGLFQISVTGEEIV